MRRVLSLAAAAALTFPAQAWPASADARLPAPPQQMFEAMLFYAEQGSFDKAVRVLDNMAPLLLEIKAAYGTDLAGETRAALKKRDAWQAQTAVLKVVYYHMKLELATALQAQGHRALVSVRVAYLDYLFLVPRLRRKDKTLAAAAERHFKSVHELVGSDRTAAKAEDSAAIHIPEIERI
ncbi:MAG: hypothetical protein AAB262_08640 [Elusimicrobiota bacterium]